MGDEDLRQPFSQFGEIVSVKIPAGKACGFVQFANRYHCCYAIIETMIKFMLKPIESKLTKLNVTGLNPIMLLSLLAERVLKTQSRL